MNRHAAIFLLLALLAPSRARGGAFTIVPLKLFLDGRKKTEVVRIQNKGDEPVTVQVRTLKWTQDEAGEEKMEPTEEIVVFPKMINLARAEERMVRIGFQGSPPAGTEGSYRIYLDEIPVAQPGEVMVKMALSIGIPVFVSPAKEGKPVPLFEAAGLKGGKVAAKVRNGGNAHFMVGKIRVQGKDSGGAESFAIEETGWYVLPGASKTYHLDIPRRECLKSKSIRVMVRVDRTDMERSFDVDPSHCPATEPGSDNAIRLEERKPVPR